MRKKILLLQILLLYICLGFNLITPHILTGPFDHFLNISSENFYNPILYYLTSFPIFVAQWTGKLTLVLTLFHTFLVFALFWHRSKWSDLFFLCLIVPISFELTAHLLPQGVGVHFLTWHDTSFPMKWQLIIFFTSLTFLLFLAFNGDTKIKNQILNRWNQWKAYRLAKQLEKKQGLASPEQSVDDHLTPNQVEEIFHPNGEIEIEKNLQVEKESFSPPSDALNQDKNTPLPIIATKDAVTYEPQELISCIRPHNFEEAHHPVPESYFQDITLCLEEKFQEFKVAGHIVNVLQGPVVNTFEVELGAGVKVSRLTSITEDLSLALCGLPIRMVYPMKGKSTIGIEIPRQNRDVIYLDELLSGPSFEKGHHALPIALGKNSYGQVRVVDLASMPHMLVAGSTGSGKSVFINTLLVSLLVKKPPQKMKLLLIDPKQLELILYSNLEHLLLPVITDSHKASAALNWACEEMERRYSILKELGVRNVESFNEKIPYASTQTLSKIKHLYLDQGEEGFELPYIVIIIDEFADLILGRMGKNIELSICRLAAKARASGIHLVIATQRPSVDVVTGLIKSNFSTRISFRVVSNIDSRTILNSLGAEKLLGKGDMLYRNGVEMERLHSAYIGEDEIDQLTQKLGVENPSYHPSALDYILRAEKEYRAQMPSYSSYGSDEEDCVQDEFMRDELYNEAVKIVREQKMASASLLQRRLKIGYNRAANLVEVLEADGLIGPQQGSRPRKVYVAEEDISPANE